MYSYSEFQTNYDNTSNPTPRTAQFIETELLREIGAPSSISGLDPSQVPEEYFDVSQSSQPPQAEHAQYYTPSETMSSPDGSVGQMTPSPKQKRKSLHKRQYSALRNQYIPTPTSETHNTVETSHEINDNSTCDTSAETMAMADNGLQSDDVQTNSGIGFSQVNPATFTSHNDQSHMALYCGQNLGYQNAQLYNHPYAAAFFRANQPFNNAALISNCGYTNPASQFNPQQQTLDFDNVNVFNPDSLIVSNTPNFGRNTPASQFNPPKQTPAIGVEADNANPYIQRQTSSPSHMMPNNSQQMKAQKGASRVPPKAIYFDRILKAMKDIENAQDNAGMLDTWEKMMVVKKNRIVQVCTELVEKVYEAQQKAPVPLGENGKYSIVEYKSVEDRMQKLEAVLSTQKTVCKHLLEDSYINQVVTDPESAQKRVENNRRVNYQKKQAIEEGRKRIGVKGRGKGVPIRAIRKNSEEQESGDECLGTSGNTNNSPENQGVTHSGTKRTYADVEDEDNFEAIIKESPSKRAKNTAHNRTKSTSALTIDTVAASSINNIRAARVSAHRHSNSYPGPQPLSARHGLSATLVPTLTSGLPHTLAAPNNGPAYPDIYQDYPLPTWGPEYFPGYADEFGADPFMSSPLAAEMGGNLQSPQADN